MPRPSTCYSERKNRRRRHVPGVMQDERDGCEIPDKKVRFCYRLNLRMKGSTSTGIMMDADSTRKNSEGTSSSSNSLVNTTPLEAAIQAAEIFNGITVGKDGVLLSQNGRSKRLGTDLVGTVVSEGQTRQAIKIERMLDSMESQSTGKFDSERTTLKKPTQQLLVVRGHFDDLHRLISERAEELRGDEPQENAWNNERKPIIKKTMLKIQRFCQHHSKTVCKPEDN